MLVCAALACDRAAQPQGDSPEPVIPPPQWRLDVKLTDAGISITNNTPPETSRSIEEFDVIINPQSSAGEAGDGYLSSNKRVSPSKGLPAGETLSIPFDSFSNAQGRVFDGASMRVAAVRVRMKWGPTSTYRDFEFKDGRAGESGSPARVK